jgi:hypothetical protein
MEDLVINENNFQFADLFMDHGIDIKEVLERRLKAKKDHSQNDDRKGFEIKQFFFDCLDENKIEIAKLILFKELKVRFKLKISIIYFSVFQELLIRFLGCFYSFHDEDR